MPRNGANIYSFPPGTEGLPDQTIESEKYNDYIADVALDLNTPRPIVAGGTGATTAEGALIALGGEKANQTVDNYDTYAFKSGSFHSASSATAPPVVGHVFTGTANVTDADTATLVAIDNSDPNLTPYFRSKAAGVWSAWVTGVTRNYVDGKPSIVSSDTPPAGAIDNSLWFESDTGLLYVRYNDGNGPSQWCIACPQPDISIFATKTETDAVFLLKADTSYVDTQDGLIEDALAALEARVTALETP